MKRNNVTICHLPFATEPMSVGAVHFVAPVVSP